MNYRKPPKVLHLTKIGKRFIDLSEIVYAGPTNGGESYLVLRSGIEDVFPIDWEDMSKALGFPVE